MISQRLVLLAKKGLTKSFIHNMLTTHGYEV